MLGAVFVTAFAQFNVFADDKKTDKNKEKVVVLFKDGTKILEREINKDLEEIPDQLSAKMSLAEIKSFLAWKHGYNRVMTEVAKKSGIANKKEVKRQIEKRRITAAGFLLLDDEAKKLMTFEALKSYYDEVWKKNFEGTQEFSLTAITTNDEKVADDIRKNVKDEASLKKALATHSTVVKSMEMDSRPEGIFPPEIRDAISKQGKNSVVGPFKLNDAYMLFFVKSIGDAKKQEFNEEFAERFKNNVAMKEFANRYTKTLFKKYNVKIFDLDGKEVDPVEATAEHGGDKKDDSGELVAKDDTVLAKMDGEEITVKKLKEFFKVKSLADETFKSMAQQFNISNKRVVSYAVKLMVDDELLAKEVKSLDYCKNEQVKEKLKDIDDMEIQHAYFKANIKVKPDDIKRTYNNAIKSIPDDVKNDNEIAVKLIFFTRQEDASKKLNTINAGEEKFGDMYKERSAIKEKETADLGYIKRQGTDPGLWALLARTAPGTCCKEVVNLDGGQFGVKNKKYAIVYVANRRPVTLPSLSNENEKKYFERLAEREKAVELAKKHLIAKIRSIEGRDIEELDRKNPEYITQMLSVLIGYAG
jgi:hypothetical protein